MTRLHSQTVNIAVDGFEEEGYLTLYFPTLIFPELNLRDPETMKEVALRCADVVYREFDFDVDWPATLYLKDDMGADLGTFIVDMVREPTFVLKEKEGT